MRPPLAIVRPLVETFSAGATVAAHDVGAFEVVIVNGPNAAVLRSRRVPEQDADGVRPSASAPCRA